MPTIESLLTVPQVAKLIGLAPRTVWRMISEGHTPETIRVGRYVRFKASEVNHWIKAGCPCRTGSENSIREGSDDA